MNFILLPSSPQQPSFQGGRHEPEALKFLISWNNVRKSLLFRILKNPPELHDWLILGRPRSVFGPKWQLWASIFASNFNKTKYQKYESRKAIYEIGTKILLFSFDESLLDAESSLEHVLDTNITNFLRRFWTRYQNGITSNNKKVTCLVLQVVFFSKIPPGGIT